MKEHLVDRPDKTSIIGCIETYEVDPVLQWLRRKSVAIP